MICWNCGVANPGGYSFCWNCHVPAVQPPTLVASRTLQAVDLGAPATLADAQAAVDAAIAAMVANGFLPELVEPLLARVPTGFGFVGTKVAIREWASATLAAARLVTLGGGTSNAAFAACAAMTGGATPTFRSAVEITVPIGGRPTDLLVMLFTNGAPGGSTLAGAGGGNVATITAAEVDSVAVPKTPLKSLVGGVLVGAGLTVNTTLFTAADPGSIGRWRVDVVATAASVDGAAGGNFTVRANFQVQGGPTLGLISGGTDAAPDVSNTAGVDFQVSASGSDIICSAINGSGVALRFGWEVRSQQQLF